MNNAKRKKDILEFREYLENNGYSKHVLPIYIRKVKIFLKSRNHVIFSEFDNLELKLNINEYMGEIPLTSQKSMIQAALHAYYSFVSGNLFIKRLNLNMYDFDFAIESELCKFQEYLKEVYKFCNSTIVSQCSTVKFFLYSSFQKSEFNPKKITFEHVYIFLTNTLSHLSKSSKKQLFLELEVTLDFLSSLMKLNQKLY